MLNFNHLSDLIDMNSSFKCKCFQFMQDIFILKNYFEWVKPLFRMQENISYLQLSSSGGAMGPGLGSSDLEKSTLQDDFFFFLPVKIMTGSHLPQVGHNHMQLNSLQMSFYLQGNLGGTRTILPLGNIVGPLASFSSYLCFLVKTSVFNGWICV